MRMNKCILTADQQIGTSGRPRLRAANNCWRFKQVATQLARNFVVWLSRGLVELLQDQY